MDTYNYHDPIPKGKIGSEEGRETPVPDTAVHTVAMYSNETRDPNMHCAENVTGPVRLQRFIERQPQSAPMPRTAGDQGYLEPKQGLQADPVMIDENYKMGIQDRSARKKDLFGPNRDGVTKE